MALQLKKQTSASVANAMDSDHFRLFIDSSDSELKAKDYAGTVTSLAGGGGGGGATYALVESDFEHAGSGGYSTYEQVDDLDIILPASKTLRIDGKVIISTPTHNTDYYQAWKFLTSEGSDDSGWMQVIGGTYNDYESDKINSVHSQGIISKTNTYNNSSDRRGIYTFSGIILTGASVSTLSTHVKATSNQGYLAPQIWTGSFISYTELD